MIRPNQYESSVNPFDPIVQLHLYSDSEGDKAVGFNKLRNGCRYITTSEGMKHGVVSTELISEIYEYVFKKENTVVDEKIINEFKQNNNIPSSNNLENLSNKEISEKIDNLLSEVLTSANVKDIPEAKQIRELLLDQSKEVDVPSYRLSDYLDEEFPQVVYVESTNKLEDTVPVGSIGSESNKTFNNLIKNCGYDPENLRSMKTKDQARAINDISAEIDGDVNKLWKQKTVEVDIQEIGGDFIPLIRDTEIEDKDVNRGARHPSERSQGFQWFLSFHINTSAVASDEKNKIILLDDPATLLHPEGKKDWIDAIEGMTDNNQIIYTSHSPYLIRKDRPSRIRIVEDRSGKGTKITDQFENAEQDSLEPLRNALGIGIGSTLFATKKKILVEGPSDVHILRGVSHNLSEYHDKNIINMESVSMIPAGGGNKIIQAAKWLEYEDFAYTILLDKDQKGNEVANNILDEAPNIHKNRIIQLDLDDGKPDNHIEIEDMFPAEFYIDCVNSAYENIEDYNKIEIHSENDQQKIGDVDYNGRKIASKVDTEFSNKSNGGLDKLMVAKHIEQRLKSEKKEENIVNPFVNILAKVNNIL